MKLILSIAAALLCFIATAHASGTLVTQLNGVYKQRFRNAMADGRKYWAQNILELDRIDNDTLYMYTKTAFYDGQHCEVYGWAKPSSPTTLTFQDASESCKMELMVRDRLLVAVSATGCDKFCGTRGSLSSFQFDLANRRAISYPTRLRNSPSYNEVIDAIRDSNEQEND